MATDVIARLLFLQHQDARQPLSLCIESPGGTFAAGMAIIDTVRSLAPPVRAEALSSLTASPPLSWPPVAGVIEFVGLAAELSLSPVWAPDPKMSTDVLNCARQSLAGVIADLSGQPEEVVRARPLDGAALHAGRGGSLWPGGSRWRAIGRGLTLRRGGPCPVPAH